jgi:glycosyltransferase involved in cell wall biosynthesis
MSGDFKISVVTPTLRRPTEIRDLLANLNQQSLLPFEIIIVDGAPDDEKDTETIVPNISNTLRFDCRYIRYRGGTAIQRNIGIEAATGEFIAFIDDDIRLEPDFFKILVEIFHEDKDKKIGGISGYPVNDHFSPSQHTRWKWYKRLRLFTTYDPGSYDFDSGVPININLQPPFSGLRRIELMPASNALWRRDVLEEGLRFDVFFKDFGVAEDYCFSLKAGRNWQLLQCGNARCQHLRSPGGRVNQRKLGVKSLINYYYLFQEIAGPLNFRRKFNFFRFQMFELMRILSSCVRRHRRQDFQELLGRLEGFWAITRGKAFKS